MPTSTLDELVSRPPPQVSFVETTIDPSSFFGHYRSLFASRVLKTQLERLKESGAFDSFQLNWHPSYDVKRSKNGCSAPGGSPPGFIWASDIGKWIEAACYFLADPSTASSPHATEFKDAIAKLIGEMNTAQEPDGYLNAYFQMADREGMLKNLRDLCEGYSCGHLIEAALAHHVLTGSDEFLNIMIKNLECFMRHLGPTPPQMPGYPGHPELELAALRLYRVTKDPQHLAFAEYLLEERGQRRDSLGGLCYLDWEADQRADERYPSWISDLGDHRYSQSHKPLHEQDDILGHSVQAFYLLTAAADLPPSSAYLADAQRLFSKATTSKMYITGGFGSDPSIEGFHDQPYWLPQSTDEGGCYAETCASISGMMVAERLLSHSPNEAWRATLERCLYNNVLGGVDGEAEAFYYWNKLATSGGETNERNKWYEVCCCPPNLARTVGMLGGYVWTVHQEGGEGVALDVHLFTSAKRDVVLGDGGVAVVKMTSGVPWDGGARFEVELPHGQGREAVFKLRIPRPGWAGDYHCSADSSPHGPPGYMQLDLACSTQFTVSFTLPLRLLAHNPRTGQDVLTLTRGPIVYCLESTDNTGLDRLSPHFQHVGISQNATFTERRTSIGGFEVVVLVTSEVFLLQLPAEGEGLSASVDEGVGRKWKRWEEDAVFVPFFVRGNRGGARHRSSLWRVGQDETAG